MSYNYAVSAHKPTNVSHSLVGHFTAPDQLNLIISKCTRIEVMTIDNEGLHQVLDVPLYGRVATMELWRPNGHTQDSLFICTERYQFCILAYDSPTGEIITKAKGDVRDRTGRPADMGQIGIVDPQCRLIGLHLFDGLFKVIPAELGGSLRSEAFNIRLEELQVLDVVFLHEYPKPTLALLYEDSKGVAHLKTYELLLREKDLTDGPWAQSTVEGGASTLIALPFGGVLVLGETSITYHSGTSFKTITVEFSSFKAYGMVDADGTRWLLGDHQGWLRVLVLTLGDRNEVLSLSMEKLGRTSQASCISYMTDGKVFLGSCFGDSQYLQLNTVADENGSFITELSRWPNLGPIADFAVIDLERQGQGQVVTCSGAYRDGSLRVVSNGIGINEQACVGLPGVKGLWSLKRISSDLPTFLVLSFVSETRVLAMQDELELAEVEIAGFDADSPTLYCASMARGQAIIQVTPRALRLIDSTTLSLVETWSPPDGSNISMACATDTHLLFATAGKKLRLFAVQSSRFEPLSEVATPQEVACVALQSVAAQSDAMDTGEAEGCLLAAAGLWTDLSVLMMTVPSLDVCHTERLGSEVIPRSLLFFAADARCWLLCAMGDGRLMSFVLSDESRTTDSADAKPICLSNRKIVSLGTQPISLISFWSGSTQHVFAASDRPTVVHANNGKLLYSNVNLKVAAHMAPFHSDALPDCLAISTEDSLLIGTIDEIQKLHIRTVPLEEQPRRLCHLESVRLFALLTVAIETGPSGDEMETNAVRLLDDTTFEMHARFPLQQQETACSLLWTTFAGEAAGSFLVVGTAFVLPDEPEPTSGRILIFEIQENSLELRHEHQTKGAVYCLEAYNGNLLAGVNNKLQMFGWAALASGTAHGLSLRHEHCGHILVLYIQSRGDFILVGDLMKSMTLLQYSASTGELTELARDFNANWMTAISFLDDETYIGAENGLNLFVLRKNSDAATDEERQRLEVVGEYHLGEFVNKFRRGSLTMQVAEGGAAPLPTLLYGTVNGVLGVLASLPQQQFALLSKVQNKLTKVVKGVGGLSHRDFRSFCSDRKTVEANGFVDGDLIESFLGLSADKMAEVVDGLDVTVEELTRTVEDLARLH